jgi:ribonuclease HII
MPSFRYERGLYSKGYATIAGVDEAGRGCLFGPVVAAAVIFPPPLSLFLSHVWIKDLDDSKKISPSKRETLAQEILMHARSVGIGMATSREIDKINIREASFLAMRRAIANLEVEADFLLIDGFRLEDADCPQLGIPKGDATSSSIAAASIMAKVVRDGMMRGLDKLYQGYGIAQHKGYGTKKHFDALKNLGPSPLHRRSFKISRAGEQDQ